ncbi:hypothetical protein L1887_16116 [Cichorium endivia]|nr:hypothetical protein L1887_16116 [Cichorium endivia]
MANVARFQRQTPVVSDKHRQAFKSRYTAPATRFRDERSFADAVRGNLPPSNASKPPIPLILNVNPEMKEWMKNPTLIGETCNLDTLSNIHSILENEGLDGIQIRYLGGLHISIQFNNPDDADCFVRNKSSWSNWFKRIDFAGNVELRFERIVDEEWCPFDSRSKYSQGSSDEDDDDDDPEDEGSDVDGISDTWDHNTEKLEEGEIPTGRNIPPDQNIPPVTVDEPIDDTEHEAENPMTVDSNEEARIDKIDQPNNDINCTVPIVDFQTTWGPYDTVNGDSTEHNGPMMPGPVIEDNGLNDTTYCSMGFAPIKRRRLNKSDLRFNPYRRSIPVTRSESSISIDLNKDLDNRSVNTPEVSADVCDSQTALSSSSKEVEHTARIGNEIGFQISENDEILKSVVLGGGVDNAK